MVFDSLLAHYKQEKWRGTSEQGAGMENTVGLQKSTETQSRNKWPQAVMNAQSIERQRIGRGEKIERDTREPAKVSGTERKGSDSEEWRQLKISAEQSVITERERQTASFFFFFLLQRNKDTHQFKSAGFLDLTFSLSDTGWRSLFLPPRVHSSHAGRRHPSRGILGILAWPEMWRWWVDGGRTLCYLLLT